MNRARQSAFGIAAVLIAGVAGAENDKDLVIDKVEPKVVAKYGWKPIFSVGASISFSDSRDVVGAQDGSTWNIGPQLDIGIDYYGTEHEWRNLITIRHVQTKTPAIDEFVKTVDSFIFDSIYLYHVPGVPWVGPFGQFVLTTALFPGEDVRPTDVNYLIAFTDGPPQTKTQSRIDLTEAFAPLTLKQSIGAFIAPVTEPDIKVEFRVGIGAKETLTQQGFALTDDAATLDVVEVTQLRDYQQIGGELFAGISGAITFDNLGPDRPLIYSLTAETLLPFFSSIDDSGAADDEKTFGDKVTFNLDAKLGVKLFSWMSLDYNLRVVREPLLVDEFQLQNTLLLNFSWAYTEG